MLSQEFDQFMFPRKCFISYTLHRHVHVSSDEDTVIWALDSHETSEIGPLADVVRTLQQRSMMEMRE